MFQILSSSSSLYNEPIFGCHWRIHNLEQHWSPQNVLISPFVFLLDAFHFTLPMMVGGHYTMIRFAGRLSSPIRIHPSTTTSLTWYGILNSTTSLHYMHGLVLSYTLTTHSLIVPICSSAIRWQYGSFGKIVVKRHIIIYILVWINISPNQNMSNKNLSGSGVMKPSFRSLDPQSTHTPRRKW